MSLVKELFVLSVCLCVTQIVHGKDIGQDFMTHNIHIFNKNFEDVNFARQVRELGQETLDMEEQSDEPSVEENVNVDTDAMQQTVNDRINGLLDEETFGQSLISISQSLKEIFENPIAETTITEVADRIQTIMTQEESLQSMRALQTRIKFFLLNKKAPGSVQEAVNPFVSFVTNPENVARVEERGRFIIELAHVASPGQNTFADLQTMLNARLKDPNAKRRIERLFDSIHLLAEVDPQKTMSSIVARVPGMTYNRLFN